MRGQAKPGDSTVQAEQCAAKKNRDDIGQRRDRAEQGDHLSQAEPSAAQHHHDSWQMRSQTEPGELNSVGTQECVKMQDVSR